MQNYYITPDEYETAENNGISEHTLYQRIRILGWKKQKAITEPVKQRNNRKKWAKTAASNGINYNTFISRVIHSGWSEEKAATTPVKKRG